MVQSAPPRAPEQTKWPFPVVLPQRFSTLYERYLSRGGINDIVADATAYAGEESFGDPARLVFFWLAFDQIVKERVAGDIAELGVYKGQTATVLARKARQLGRIAYLLDTFEGFDARDFQGPDAGRRGGFADTSLEAVQARVGEQNTKFVKGFFPDSAKELPADGSYCFVHIDCDLYAPIMKSLEYFYPRLTPGGFLIVHDYSSLGWAGADKAVDTFFADKPESIIPLPDNAGSAAIRKLRPPGVAPNWLMSKQALDPGQWYSAGNNQLSDLLGEGWSGPEQWGVWGVDTTHVLMCCPSDPTLHGFAVDVEVGAALLPGIMMVQIDVLLEGQFYTTWSFSARQNRAIRTIDVPAASHPLGQKSVEILFRPHSMVIVRDHDPTSSDRRKLGMALYRIRVRGADDA